LECIKYLSTLHR